MDSGPSLGKIDVEAVATAIGLLTDEDIQVTDVQGVDRDGQDGRVRWTMTCEADARTTGLNDFLPEDE